MNLVYKRICNYVKPDPGTVFIEIGSERGEGSTAVLAELAQEHNVKFITVDLDDQAKKREDAPLNTNIEWHLGKPGSAWCRDVWPNIAQPISMLFLDNFDWDWEASSSYPSPYQHQIDEYKSRWQIEMNNENSQLEHFTQFLLLESYLTQNAVVACDDTCTERGVWTGKCGPIVVYLLAKGWTLHDRECGVILTK